VALAAFERLTYSYPGAAEPALRDVTLEIGPGEIVALLGPSGSGKSTLVRALAGLVPHFHGGRFAGRAVVAGHDTRLARPADLARKVATVFQDPEDQVVMSRVRNEVAFGLENLGVPASEIWPRVESALNAVGALHLADRRTAELSSGELQRVCLASALALEPALLLLDEPTSQLDPSGADALLSFVERVECAVVLSEQRTGRALALAERVLFAEGGRLLCDAPLVEAVDWLAEHRPAYLPPEPPSGASRAADDSSDDFVCRLEGVSFAYTAGDAVLENVSLEIGPGEIVALEGPNGAGKTTVAKIATGLLEAQEGSVTVRGRAGYLSQDPGRYLVKERVLDETALAVHGDLTRAHKALERVDLGWATDRHPRDLSSGERERLGLAAVAVAEPDLLVLDEPTRGVDPVRKAEIAAWLAAYAAEGRGVLVATHDRFFPADRRVSLAEEALVGV
jgi:energy-coupling factor transport system ATP-binding protein